MAHVNRARKRRASAYSDEEGVDSETELILNATKSGRTCQSTKDNYDSNLRNMYKWLEHHHPECINDDSEKQLNYH